MVATVIIIATLIWVVLILVARAEYCWLLRKNSRRVTCKNCPKKAHCVLFDATGATKPCAKYSGPERRRYSRDAGMDTLHTHK